MFLFPLVAPALWCWPKRNRPPRCLGDTCQPFFLDQRMDWSAGYEASGSLSLPTARKGRIEIADAVAIDVALGIVESAGESAAGPLSEITRDRRTRHESNAGSGMASARDRRDQHDQARRAQMEHEAIRRG